MELAITGLGMMTSLGGVVAGSAAQKAGLSRPVEIDFFEVCGDEGIGSANLIGHRVTPSSEGFFQIGLWVRMAFEAMGELLRYGAVADPGSAAFWQRTAIFAALPVMEFDRFYWPEDQVIDGLREHFLGSVTSLLDLPISKDQLFVFPNGRCATARALVAARAQIERGRFDRAIVVGADSWVDPQSLAWLAEHDRLKHCDNPAGLVPSEAAACFLLETEPARRRRGATAEAVVEAVSVIDAPGAKQFDAAATGSRVAKAIQLALGAAGETSPFAGDIYFDLNGETWNATAWGHAQPLLLRHIDFARTRLLLPCAELGDTGAASAAVAVCLGTRAFVRGWARGPRALVCSISESGDASVLVLAAPRS